MGFNQPVNSGMFFRPRDHADHLILIVEAHSAETRYDDLRKADMLNITVDMVDLDADEPELLGQVILSHPGLTNKVKVGSTMILGRIGTVKARNGNDAFTLMPFTTEDAVRAEAWVEQNKTRPTFTAPKAATKVKRDEPEDDPFATPKD